MRTPRVPIAQGWLTPAWVEAEVVAAQVDFFRTSCDIATNTRRIEQLRGDLTVPAPAFRFTANEAASTADATLTRTVTIRSACWGSATNLSVTTGQDLVHVQAVWTFPDAWTRERLCEGSPGPGGSLWVEQIWRPDTILASVEFSGDATASFGPAAVSSASVSRSTSVYSIPWRGQNWACESGPW